MEKLGNITLYNADCMEIMKGFADKQFGLALVDPPYGIDASKGTWGSSNKGNVKDYGKKTWDKKSPDKCFFDELIRVSKNQIIFGANHFISKIPYDSSCWIVWDKDNTGDFADCELAWTSFDTAVRKFTFRWNGMLQGNMKNKELRIHPTQKPVALYKWILKNYANEGETVLDNCMGSGTTAIACMNTNRNFIGFEMDKTYYQIACDRIQNALREPRLAI